MIFYVIINRDNQTVKFLGKMTNFEKLKNFLETSNDFKLKIKLQKTLLTLKESISNFKLFLSFNGGKDCTLLLYLYLFALDSMKNTQNNLPKKQFLEPNSSSESETNPQDYLKFNFENIKCLYVAPTDPFQAVEDFIAKTVEKYSLQLFKYHDSLKKSLELFLSENECNACLMGTRSTDPYSDKLKTFQQTDQGWPAVMRIHPLLDWSYKDVWDVLLLIGEEYCELYDLGYTSLGSIQNTRPNSFLKNGDSFLPAFMLQDQSKERFGRL
jgi:FAD synthetase